MRTGLYRIHAFGYGTPANARGRPLHPAALHQQVTHVDSIPISLVINLGRPDAVSEISDLEQFTQGWDHFHGCAARTLRANPVTVKPYRAGPATPGRSP